MKHKKDCLLREIAGEFFVIPTGGSAINLSGMITLSETSAFVWRLLDREQSYEAVLDAVLKAYAVDRPTAEADLRELLSTLDRLELLEGQTADQWRKQPSQTPRQSDKLERESV